MKKILERRNVKKSGDEVLRKELSVKYSGDRLDPAVNEYRKKQQRIYFLIAAVTVLIIAVMVLYGLMTQKEISSIDRPVAGESPEKVPVMLEAEYKGKTVRKNINLNVAAVARTEKEKRKMLKKFADELPDMIAEEKNGKRIVVSDLNLITKDRSTGIEIRWTSGFPEAVSEDGKVDVTFIKGKSETVELTAELSLDEEQESTSFEIEVIKDPELYESSVKNQISILAAQISESSEGKRIKLPSELSNGIKLKWKTGGGYSAALVMVIGLLILYFAYSRRFERAKKSVKDYRTAVISEFPDVIDKLVLLLNSGLTVFSALMRLSEEYECNDMNASSAIGIEMADIGRRVRNTNTSVIDEWKAFAVRMESADILRFCTILEDNISKGSELCSKLENESEIFMDMRKKNLQQHIRTIDSKMMIPMMVMLMSLILITISPVITGF